MDIRCIGCNKKPDELEEYVVGAKALNITPEQYIKQEEGTYNSANGHFACDRCYIQMGMPANPFPAPGWVAP